VDDSITSPSNGILESGERGHIVLLLQNIGTGPAIRVSAKIINKIPGWEFTTDSHYYPDLPAKSENPPQPAKNNAYWPSYSMPKYFAGPWLVDIEIVYGENPTRTNLIKDYRLVDIKPLAWIAFEPIDFGVVQQGMIVSNNFIVRNVGSAMLTVSSITSSNPDDTICSPITPPSFEIPANSSTNLTVTLLTSNMNGWITRNLSFASDARIADPAKERVDIACFVFVPYPVFKLPTTTMDAGIDVGGGYIVWLDYRNGHGNIYGYDLKGRKEFPICTNASAKWRPLISGTIVAWEDSRNWNMQGTRTYDIYGYDLSTKNEFIVSIDAANETLVGVDKNRIVFARDYAKAYSSKGALNYTLKNLFVYDKENNSSITMTSFVSNETHSPMNTVSLYGSGIGNDLLVWEESTIYWRAAGTNFYWDIQSTRIKKLAYGTDMAPIEISVSGHGSFGPIAVDGPRIAWGGAYKSDGTEYDQIWMWDTGNITMVTTSPEHKDTFPFSLSGNYLVYGKTSDERLYLWDITNHSETLIADQAISEREAVRIKDGLVAWTDNGGVYFTVVDRAIIGLMDDIQLSDNNPIVGQPITVTAMVQNMAKYPCYGSLTNRLYLGDPDNGGTEIGSPQIISGGLTAWAKTNIQFTNVIFTNEGTHQLYVKIFSSAQDFTVTNTAASNPFYVGPAQSPIIRSTYTNGNVVLMWPTNAVGYALEHASKLTSPQWKPVLDTPQTNYDRIMINLRPSDFSSFYRLKK
jgi:beta propeller repeat protein